MIVRAACFDLDGCLVDSRHAITTAINHALAQVGLATRPREELYRFIGPPLLATFRECLAAAGQDDELAHAAIAAYRDVYPELALSQTPVFDGIPEMLARLTPQMPLAVVTSKPAAYARPIVEAVGLSEWFTEVHGPELHALDEPKSVKLRVAISSLGMDLQPGSVAMIGDRLHDIEAGRACGTQTIGVLWGIGAEDELLSAGANDVAATPATVADLLLS